MTESQQLLAEFVKTGSEVAFRELLKRYIDLVYSTAFRLADGDAHRAQDVAQAVFADLAREARKFSSDIMLGGWLHRHTCFTASKFLRTERRRQLRERQAIEMNALNSSPEHDPNGNFAQLMPVLDEVLNQLPEDDRKAILLRFYEHRDLRSIGKALGSSENAAQKRVTRALSQLHTMLLRRGIALSTASVGTFLAAQAVTAAPAGLGAAIATHALSTAPFVAGTAMTTTQAIAMTTLQKAAIIVSFAIVAGTGIRQAYRALQLRDQVRALQQQQMSSAEQIQQLRLEKDNATKQLALANDKSPSNELLRLRAEVTSLRQASHEQSEIESVIKGWTTRMAKLRRKVDEMPDKRIPEMQFLTDSDWAAATREADLDTEVGMREAMRALRSVAKENFLNAVREAIRKYAAAANGGQIPSDAAKFAGAVNANNSLLPSDLSELKPYFEVPVPDALLQRYQFQFPGKLHDNLSDIMVKEIAPPVDLEYDTNHEIGLNSGGVRNVNLIEDAVTAAARNYAKANNGLMPSGPGQIAGYLSQPLDPVLVQRYLSRLQTTAAVSGE